MSLSVLPSKAKHGEAPFWDEKTNTLVYVDMFYPPGAVVTFDGKNTRFVNSVKNMSCQVLRSNGQGYVVAQEDQIDFLSKSGELSPFVTKEAFNLQNGTVTNDGKCDAKGRLWIGTMTLDFTKPPSGVEANGGLYRVTPDGQATRMDGGRKVSNGIDWTLDNRTLFHADTGHNCVFAYDFDLEKGDIANKRTVLNFPEDTGFVDGMCTDVNDKIWAAFWNGGRIGQYDVETGKLLRNISTAPTSQTTSCVFAGPGLEELWITTSTVSLSEQQLAAQPNAGAIYKLTGLGTKGKRSIPFAG
ncbi:regucalcin [Aplysia californica]|uniref:Regucalcin n=1 Tax=Aplysia californica TaxID=6500 RepID=A0ABM0K543_APLCA|nr:regucalcin [Aplysia californica]